MLADLVRRFEKVKKDATTPRFQQSNKDKQGMLLKVKKVKIKPSEEELSKIVMEVGQLTNADMLVKSKMIRNELNTLKERLESALNCGSCKLDRSDVFIDEDFPPIRESLWSLDSTTKVTPNLAGIDDKSEYWEPCLKGDKAMCSKMSPACVSLEVENVSNVSAVLTALSLKPSRIQNLIKSVKIKSSNTEEHFFTVRLYPSGRPEDIVVDNYLPKITRINNSLSINRGHEACIWPLLTQKSLAKVFGSYSELEAKHPFHLFKLLTGAPVAKLDPSDIKNRDIILEAARKSWPMVARLRKEPSSCLLKKRASDTTRLICDQDESNQFHAVLGIVNSFESSSKSMKTTVVIRSLSSFDEQSNSSSPFTNKNLKNASKLNLIRPIPVQPSTIMGSPLLFSQFAAEYSEVTVCLVHDRYIHSSVTEVGLKSLHLLSVETAGKYYFQASIVEEKTSKSSTSLALVVVQRLSGYKTVRLKHLKSTASKEGSVLIEITFSPGEYVLFIDLDSQEAQEYCITSYGPSKIEFQDISISKLSPERFLELVFKEYNTKSNK